MSDSSTTPDDAEGLGILPHGEVADPALSAVIGELEAHAAEVGWDRPATIYALVDTASFIASEPTLASLLGITADTSGAGSLTPIEQDQFTQPLEEVLPTLGFGASVAGVAVIVERPGGREGATTEGESEHVRVIAGVTRTGSTYCALRSRVHDRPEAIVTGSGDDLVPQLVDLLRAVLEEDQ